jgi:hypothetical protein
MSNRTRRTPQAETPASSTSSSSTQGTSVGPDNSVIQEEVIEANRHYTGAFGDTIGGFLYEQVEGATGPEQIDGYAADGFGAAGEWIGDRAVEAASDEDRQHAEAFRTHLEGAFREGYGGQFAESGIGEGVSDWARENPWGVAGLGALGAAGFILSDQDLSFDTDVGVGRNLDLMLGGDFGSTLDPGIDALRAGAEYSRNGMSLGLEGEQRFDRDEWSLGAYYRNQGDWGRFSANADVRQLDDEYLARAGMSFRNDDLQAALNGSYDTATDFGQINGSISTLGEGPVYSGGFDANTRGDWNVNAGVSHERENLQWNAGVFAGENQGQFDAGVRAGLSYRF